MGETSKNQILSTHQSIPKVDFDWTESNELGNSTFWRFGRSKYNQYLKGIYFPMSLNENI